MVVYGWLHTPVDSSESDYIAFHLSKMLGLENSDDICDTEFFDVEPSEDINNPNLEYIQDWMCGEYEYFGIPLANINEYDDMKDISFDISELQNLREMLYKKCTEKHINTEIFGEPSLHIFVHRT